MENVCCDSGAGATCEVPAPLEEPPSPGSKATFPDVAPAAAAVPQVPQPAPVLNLTSLKLSLQYRPANAQQLLLTLRARQEACMHAV